MEAYRLVTERAREVTLLQSAHAVLQWDQETMMPPQGAAWRAEQQANLSGLAHRRWTAPEVGEWITTCAEAINSGNEVTATNIREWQRDYLRATRLPAELVEECTRTESQAHHAWVEARQKNEFHIFAPWLARLVDQARRKADLWGYSRSPYDALLEGYEPGATVAELEKLFGELAPRLTQLVTQGVTAQQQHPAPPLPPGPYPVEAQRAFNQEVATALGFDFSAGRLDTAAHPFCTGLGPRDCRLTTRYDEQDFTSSLYGVMHETGHGLYEQGLPAEHYGTPSGQPASLGVHESQSRLWENHVGRQLEFWEHWFPRAFAYFPQLRQSSPQALWQHVNRIERSWIRVEADEVTYDLHIILRFEVERRLIEGHLQVEELPAFWNTEFERLLGLKVPDDRRGCLQDIHWSMGGFGYFPTYTLGNLMAAQIMETLRQKSPELDDTLRHGNYHSLLHWLRQNIHQSGMRHHRTQLIQSICGTPPSPQAHLNHLSRKVRQISAN